MARKKVKLAWIANESARKATFKKRRKGLMKKVRELSVLCDVKACGVVYAPNEAQAVEVWQRFKSIPEMEKTKKMMNQESFLRHLIAKLQEQLHKQEKENREMETRLFMYRALASGEGREAPLHAAMTIQDVTCLAWLVEVKVKAVQERLDLLLKGRIMPILPRPPKVEQDHVEKEKVAVTASASAAEATAAMRLNIEGEIQAQDCQEGKVNLPCDR
ncbi:hypothetical protein J5N97_021562 [Dioscorea zingiberensis]|uniref:MADS-box domain-containing protein n=1 Tax=Dioscorea zingiberensis TaxID=325984 RepID=A0A9D5HA17_9LILI|nr:hypothetical protein J5N97_021562 [Dioscorea zingiberensis]